MSNEQNALGDTDGKLQIRNDLVDTAVNFLLNPSVIDKPYSHKTAFLKKKGLTDHEISLAHENAEKDPRYKDFLRRDTAAIAHQPILPPPVPVYGKPITFWSKLSRVSSSFIILGVALFGAHYIYKNYIEPLIFGRDPNKPKCLEQQLLDVTISLSAIEDHIATLEEEIKSQKQQLNVFLQTENEYFPTSLAIRELKTEVINIKSLLVSRHQFPALPKVSTLSIPEWQLPSQEDGSSKPKGEVKENGNFQTPEKLSPSDESFSILQNGASEESLIKSDTENESLAT